MEHARARRQESASAWQRVARDHFHEITFKVSVDQQTANANLMRFTPCCCVRGWQSLLVTVCSARAQKFAENQLAGESPQLLPAKPAPHVHESAPYDFSQPTRGVAATENEQRQGLRRSGNERWHYRGRYSRRPGLQRLSRCRHSAFVSFVRRWVGLVCEILRKSFTPRSFAICFPAVASGQGRDRVCCIAHGYGCERSISRGTSRCSLRSRHRAAHECDRRRAGLHRIVCAVAAAGRRSRHPRLPRQDGLQGRPRRGTHQSR